MSAGEQLLDALVRETEDLRRVPHGQVGVADERPGGSSLCLGGPGGGALGVGLCRVCVLESFEHRSGQLRAPEGDAARHLSLIHI